MAHMASLQAPNIEIGSVPNEASLDEYRERINQTLKLMTKNNLDFLVVYGDREYFGDLYHLTGVDPRFEEGLLILASDGKCTLLLGNEDLTYGPAASLGMNIVLFQEFSPQGQRRDLPIRFVDILREAGITAGSRVGVSGQKTLSSNYFDSPESLLSVPSYIADSVRNVVADSGVVTDAKYFFTDPVDGLRSRSTAAQIARFEYGSSVVSSSVLHALQKLHVGVRADELKDQLFDRGLPQTCHPMVNFGSRVGLYSPRPIAAELGAAYQIAQGNRGGLTCRSGAIAATESDLSPESRRVFPELISNYFDVVATWHETVAIGVSTGEVFRAVDEVRDGNIFEFALNPGHFLHYEEWSQSTFWKNETHILQSGSLMQCDIIPVIAGADCAVNIEDGVVLADAVLRDDLATNFPALWTRVQQRRDYLREHIGVNLDESVLPMSNIPMWQAPYVLDQSRGLTRS